METILFSLVKKKKETKAGKIEFTFSIRGSPSPVLPVSCAWAATCLIASYSLQVNGSDFDYVAFSFMTKFPCPCREATEALSSYGIWFLILYVKS